MSKKLDVLIVFVLGLTLLGCASKPRDSYYDSYRDEGMDKLPTPAYGSLPQEKSLDVYHDAYPEEKSIAEKNKQSNEVAREINPSETQIEYIPPQAPSKPSLETPKTTQTPPLTTVGSVEEEKEVKEEDQNTEKYTALPGDSLWKIARKFDTRVHVLKSLNNLEADTIRVGQVLKVPKNE